MVSELRERTLTPTLCRNTGRGSKAFTLVELLAATLLSALLMVAMLLVVAGLGRDRREMTRRAAADVPMELTEVLRWDLLAARTIQVREGAVILSGYGSLDAKTLAAASHRPVQVIYEVRQLGDRRWLIRRQQDPGKPKTASAELVCAGVKAIAAVPIEITDGPAKEPKPAELAKGPVAMTGQVRLSITFDTPGRKAIDETVVLR